MATEINKEGKLITFSEMWEQAGSPFQPRHFVSEPEPCGDPELYFPFPTIPRFLMKEADADAAQIALDICIKIVGPFGERRSQTKSPEFKKAAEKFKSITGVEVLAVFELAFNHLYDR